MSQHIIVINGTGGVGKDTICGIVKKHYNTMNISSVDPIKEIARNYGWDEIKDEKSRKFLADLKNLFVEFNDMPQRYLLKRYREFKDSGCDILFVHIREPREIQKFIDSIPEECITLLIRGRDEEIPLWHNAADDDVEHYKYDFVYKNSLPLKDVEADFLNFFRKEILKEV